MILIKIRYFPCDATTVLVLCTFLLSAYSSLFTSLLLREKDASVSLR